MNWLLQMASHVRPKAGGASLYGVILYTSQHAHIRKVVDDETYWQALDEVSGPRWAVFSTRAIPGRWDYPRVRPGTMALMIPVWKEPAANRDLVRDLGLEDTSQLPLLVVFSVDSERNIRSTGIHLKDQSVETAYQSIKDALESVASALERVAPELLADPESVFSGVEYQLRTFKEWKKLARGVEVWRSMRSLGFRPGS